MDLQVRITIVQVILTIKPATTFYSDKDQSEHLIVKEKGSHSTKKIAFCATLESQLTHKLQILESDFPLMFLNHICFP